MSYGIEPKKLKRLVNYYSPFNSGQEMKYLTLFNGEEGLLRYLETSPFQGIDETSIQERINWFGSNQPVQCRNNRNLPQILTSPFEYFGVKLHFVFSILVLVLSFIKVDIQLPYFWLGSVCNISLLLFCYILLVIPNLYQYFDNLELRKYAVSGSKVKVWRDNDKKEIHSCDLVVGDIVELEKGDIIGADGLIIQYGVTVKQVQANKTLTLQKKTTKQCIRKWADSQQMMANFSLEDEEVVLPSPIVLGGSEVIEGEARMVVLCVGKNSRVGSFIYQVQRAAVQRKSQSEMKIKAITFEISKYLVIAIIMFIFLYLCKTLVFLIIKKGFKRVNWLKIWLYLGKGVTVILLGLPIFQVIGLAVGSFYLKFNIYKTDGIWFKYAKDCGQMKEITSVLFEKMQQATPIKLIKWWNMEEEKIQTQKKKSKTNSMFENMFIKSLRCQDFQPYEVGLKISSFFVGLSQKNIQHIEEALYQYANERQSFQKSKDRSTPVIESVIQIEQSLSSLQNGSQKEVELIYLKGNSETMLQQCTHILDKTTGVVTYITPQKRQKISSVIQTMNIAQIPSLITGYIQVHPSHPKFREPDYKVVMLSLIGYQQTYENQQFEALHRMRKSGISFTLLGNHNHEQTVAIAQQIGIVMLDKPSIRLRGYDFNKIVGGTICKSCKKWICICPNEDNYVPVLNNQDEFNRICKHLNVISEASPIEKMNLVLGFSSAQENTCFFGSTVNDVPAMRSSKLAVNVRNHIMDSYTLAATEVVIPDTKINTMQKLVIWSYVFFVFCRKYIVFSLVPCFVAFTSSFISFLLFDSFCITLIQLVWVLAIICPIVGMTLVFAKPPSLENFEEMRIKNQPIIDKVSYRQLSSQIVAQVGVILVVLFFGPSFIPEQIDFIDEIIGDNWGAKYSTQYKNTICTGIYNDIFKAQSPVYSNTLDQFGVYSRHYTFIFNLFAIMQFINYFNCRNLGERGFSLITVLNIPTAICFIAAMGLQVIVMIFGKEVFQIYPGGLTFKQWAICLGLSLIVVLVAILTRQIPIQDQNQQKNVKIWPNRCYNLSVMAIVSRDTLQDFENDQQMDMRKISSRAE